MDWSNLPVVALFHLFRYMTRAEIETLTEALQDQQFTRLASSFFLHFPANVEGHPNPSVIMEQIKKRSGIHPTTLILTAGPRKASTDAEPFQPTTMEARILELIMIIDNDYRNCFLPNRPEVPKSWTGKLVFFVPPRDQRYEFESEVIYTWTSGEIILRQSLFDLVCFDQFSRCRWQKYFPMTHPTVGRIVVYESHVFLLHRRKCEDVANKHYFQLVKFRLDNGLTQQTEISARGHERGLCISTPKVKLITDEFKLNYIRSMWTCAQENLHLFVQWRSKQMYLVYTMSLKVDNPILTLRFSVHSDAPKPRKTKPKKKCALRNCRN